MWRFILLTFAFLGLAFYQLSGGSEYAPVAHSLQAQAVKTHAIAAPAADAAQNQSNAPADVADASAPTAIPAPDVVRVSASADDAVLPEVIEQPSRLARVAAIDAAIAEIMQDTSPVTADESDTPRHNDVFSLETYAEAIQNGTLVVGADGTAQLPDARDIRQVSGTVVNMRAGPGQSYESLGKLNRGTQIAVLDEPGNGWIRFEVVDTGTEGWMADWLVTAVN